jgi:DNA replication protein DnaC
MRRRQELACLRPRQQGLSGRLLSYVPSRATSLRLDLLILDDWGPEPLDADQRRDLLEIVEDRYEARSIIVTSQLPVDRWYEIIGNPTIADAILDRLVNNAYRIELKGESLRKQKQSAPDQSVT